MASDSEIQAKEILRIKKRMNDLYVKYTGKSLKEIEKAMDRDTFLEADEAKEFGRVDQVVDGPPGPTGDDTPQGDSTGPKPGARPGNAAVTACATRRWAHGEKAGK